MARLRVESGKSSGKVLEFDKQAVIGRGETAQIQILDLKASREHCRVFEQSGTWAVADLNSRNGIKVNGIQTTRKNLNHGDRIEIGETVLVFEVPGAAETGDSVPPVKGPGAGKASPAAPAAAKPAPAAAKPAAAPARPAPVASRAPAAKTPAKAPAKAPGSDASSKKAAAMAAARADADKAKSGAARAAAAAARPAASGGADQSGVKISDRALQYHKVDTKNAGVLDVDLTQSAGTTKFLIFVGCAAFLGVLVWVFSTLVSE